jgi:hypothetical protein
MSIKRRKIIKPRVFHYTVMSKLKSILNSGEIKPATAGVHIKERPAVFCAIEKQWEPTANKGIIQDGKIYPLHTIDEMILHAGPLIRIEIKPEAAPYRWNDYVRLSGIDKALAKELEKVAIQSGSNVNHFFMSFKPIIQNQWVSIQIFNENRIWEELVVDE